MIRGLCYSWTKLWTTCCIQWARLVLFTGAITECSMEFTAPTSIFRLNFLNSSKKDLLVSYSSIIESMEKHICWYEGSSLLNYCILLDYLIFWYFCTIPLYAQPIIVPFQGKKVVFRIKKNNIIRKKWLIGST